VGARRRALLLAVAALAAAPLVPAAAGEPGEVDPTEDDPPGCTTATSEDEEQCGAQGRAHFDAATHVPPIEACADIRSDAGSVVTRVLPDGPRHDDGSLAFVPGACVYLPPGYEGSGLRYPVVYLLHGGGGDQADWVTLGAVQATLDQAYADDPTSAVIAVMPDGRSGQWHDWYEGTFLIESYVLDHLVPYVDARFRTIADRRGRAVTGLSNGGYGAFHLAAKAPDLFTAAGSMSGNLGARSFSHLGSPQELGAYYYGNVPVTLIPNLDHVDLTIDWGATCSSDVVVDACATWAFEQAFRLDNQHFRDQLEALGYEGTYEYRETEGSHAWRWWTPWLRDRHLPFFRARLADPEPAAAPLTPSPVPERFRYRSIAESFDAFGYSVTVDREVREFLDLVEVTATRIVVRGSGTATITTAPRYDPGAAYLVGDEVVAADHDGRLRFTVDLGPSHEHEQYSPAARVLEHQPGYWVERELSLTPA
jgi:S-formylglutathione hydrolase FrmB